VYFLALIRLIKDGITPCDLNPSVRLSNICCAFFHATPCSPLRLHVQRVCAARHLHGSSWRGRSRGHCASVLHGRLLPHRCALTHIKIHRKADHIKRKGIRQNVAAPSMYDMESNHRASVLHGGLLLHRCALTPPNRNE